MNPTAKTANLTLWTFCVLALPAGAALAAENLWRGFDSAAGVRVARVVNGNTVVLADGRSLRLAGIQAPRLALRQGQKSWPMAAAARRALLGLAGGKAIRLYERGRRIDRYGRLIGHATVGQAPRIWLQGRLLARGLARVRTYPDNAHFAAKMLAIERQARAARRGIWAHDFYRVRFHRRLRGLLDTFQLVEGRVLQVAETRRWIYLNFDADWRRDFTVSIDRQSRRRFRKAGIKLKDYEGKRVRVRGWLFRRNGPMIQATHPAQIEVLD